MARGRAILLADARGIQRLIDPAVKACGGARPSSRAAATAHAPRSRMRGSRTPRRRRAAADAALSGRGLAGGPADAHHGHLQRHELGVIVYNGADPRPRSSPRLRRGSPATARTSSASRTASAISTELTATHAGIDNRLHLHERHANRRDINEQHSKAAGVITYTFRHVRFHTPHVAEETLEQRKMRANDHDDRRIDARDFFLP